MVHKYALPCIVLFLLANTALYSVVNAAQSVLPDQLEQHTTCAARMASFCGAYGENVCNAIIPQDCGAMQSSTEGAVQGHEHGIFWVLTGLLFVSAIVELFRRREALVAGARYLTRPTFAPIANSPPLLVGNLASLRF